MPERNRVDAAIDDVCNCRVETALENVAVFATRLDTVKLPFGFVIAVELNRNCDTSGAVMLV